MKFVAVLNEDGGTLKTTDIDAFSVQMRRTMEAAGHEIDVEVVNGKDVQDVLETVARRRSVDVVLVGGGDGTISTAASILKDKKKALAILPAGTMNLFARSLGIPLNLEAAVEAFATGSIRRVDIASANGRPFVHQYSIGLHAKMVQMRDAMEFGSRLGKIGASMKAAWHTVHNPPSLRVRLTIGETEIETKTSGIGVSNNLFGEGHLPYADKPDGGVLGIYVTVARGRGELVRFALNMARGKWRDNDQVEIHEAEEVGIELLSSHRKFRCVIDGELCPLDKKTQITIHPKALNVLVPGSQTRKKAA